MQAIPAIIENRIVPAIGWFIQESTNEETYYSGNDHNNDRCYGSKLFHKQFSSINYDFSVSKTGIVNLELVL